MECEILFRGKDNNIKGIDWVYGYYVKCKSPLGGINHMIYSGDIEYDCTKECYFPTEAVRNYVDPATAGRYTGLTDKNGKKIFEGDIIHAVTPNTRGNYQVKFEYGMFSIGICMPIAYVRHSGEVIGNIHDNPELLEVQG